MKHLFTSILLTLTISSFGQINMEDSSAQVVSYWSIGDQQSYTISLQKVKLKGADTTSNEIMTYDVDVTIIDSTEDSYSVEWFYHNYQSTSTNEIVQKITTLSEDLKVIIETDELGAVIGVENWEEVRDYIQGAISPLKEEFKGIPQMDQVFDQAFSIYQTKQAIEAAAIQDVQQFHNFHGARYVLGEVLEFPMQVPNMYFPEKPFDSNVTLYLDEINPEEANFIMRSSREVDSEQLTNTTYEYLKKMSETMGQKLPTKDELGPFTNVITTASRIHETGWLIYSVQTKIVEVSGASNIEERIIEIK